MLHEIKVSQKSENRRPESTLGSILEVCVGPWGDVLALFLFFLAFEKVSEKDAEKKSWEAFRVTPSNGSGRP